MENRTTSPSNAAQSPNTIGHTFLGVLVGILVAFIGVAFANDTFGANRPAIGVGFIALCAGAAFEWRRLGAKLLTSVAAGYLFGLGITLGLKLKSPAFWLPLIVGITLFTLGIIIRQYATNSKQSPPT